MKVDTHLMIATTSSMIITFAFYYGLDGTSANNSLFQYIFTDTMSDYLLVIRCLLDNWQMNDTCIYYWNSIEFIQVSIFSLVTYLNDVTKKYQPELVKKNGKLIASTWIAFWFVTRFCNALGFRCQIDVFTIFFLFWQFTFLIEKWYSLELSCFSFTLHQASLCIFVAFISYAFYDVVLRYFPVRYRLGLLWFFAIKDCIDCLHPHGRLHDTALVRPPESSLFSDLLLEPGYYHVKYPIDGIRNEDTYISVLGLGDFFFYNLMVLFVLPPLLPMATKICVAIGSIISVQVGYMATIWIAFFGNVEGDKPALPLPVITYSIYAIFVDIFMQYSNLDIC